MNSSNHLIQNLMLALLVGVIGAVLNMFRLPLFFEAEFIFGQFLVLLLAVYRGPLLGLIASCISTATLVYAWGSYWATLIFGLEAIFIGIVCRQNKSNIIIAVVAFWLFIGMPISWYSISQYEYFLDSHRTSILIKQLSNGILYAHITALVMYLPMTKKLFCLPNEKIILSIKEQSAQLISSLLITAGVAFFFYSLNQNINSSSAQFSQSHDIKHDRLKYQLTLIIKHYIDSMAELRVTLSKVWGDEVERKQTLVDFNQRHETFNTMLIANSEGEVSDSSPVDLIENILSRGDQLIVADRNYFINTINNNRTYVSPGFVGKGFGQDLIAAVSVSVPNQNKDQPNLGVVEGSFILNTMHPVIQALNNVSTTADAILIDQNNNVLIASSDLNLKPLGQVKFEKGVSDFYHHDLVSLINDQGEKYPEVYYITESNFDWGWKLVTLQNESFFAGVIEKSLIIFAISIVLVVIFSKFLARLISHSWSYYLHRLNQLIERGAGFESEYVEFEANENLPEEVKNFYQEIKQSRLKIIHMNSELQNTVAERTEKLQLANDKLNIMARKDGLTQLDNRRVFNDTLSEIWIECQRELLMMSMLIIDIDHFKKVNDTYGHPIGDEVLVYLAKELQSFEAEKIKCIARLGGEEFCLLIKGSNHQVANKLAEDIRKHIESMCIPIGKEKSIKITVSIGVGTIDPTKFTSSKLYQLADNALYEAKNSGRNLVKDMILD